MAGPLDGIRILDFTWALAGPYGVMILGDLGAEIIKVEPVGQDWQTRGNPPHIDGVSTYYFSVNRGKKSILLDLKTQKAKDVVYALAKQVDVVWNNFSPGTMDDLGFGCETLRALNPKLIYASTSGFGQYGPYRERRAVDVIVQGMSGLMSITGEAGGPPARAGYSIGDMAAGMFTAIGVLSALVERSKSGEGQEVDVAMLDSQVALLENPIIRHFATGEVPGRIGSRHPLVTPFQALPTSDGHIVIAGVRDWELFCAKIDRLEIMHDERFMDGPTRTINHAALEPILIETFSKRSSEYWLTELAEICMVAPLNTIADIAQDPHEIARGMFVDLPHPKGGKDFRVASSPVRLSRTPIQVNRPPSGPGEDTVEILRTLGGYTDAAIEEMLEEGAIGTGEHPGVSTRRR